MHRRNNSQMKVSDKFNSRINESITGVDRVRLVTEEGSKVYTFEEALKMAKMANLDLVEVSAGQDANICKIIDYGKFRFEQLKKSKEAKKKQHVVNLKEIKIRPRIDSNDYEIKKKHAIEFLSKGDKVKVTLRFKGRETMHSDLGMKVVNRMVEDLKEYAATEKPPVQEGRQIVVVFSPAK